MNRRVFLIAMTTGVLHFGTVGAAQDTPKVWRLGVLTTTPRSRDASHYHQAFIQELGDQGYREGQNLIVGAITAARLSGGTMRRQNWSDGSPTRSSWLAELRHSYFVS